MMAIGFIELNRIFVPIEKDEEPNYDLNRLLDGNFIGGLDWKALLQYRRVVLLAEASSGKTEEFKNQAKQLTADGQSAYYVFIQEIFDIGFEAALEPELADDFQSWMNGTDEGWFFLDALDEVRLNQKKFETALKRFARALGSSIERARVFISCRVSDWKGREDRIAIERLLPVAKVAPAIEKDDETDFLLDPIFNKNSQSKEQIWEPEAKANKESIEPLIVQLAPLSEIQYRIFAEASGIKEVDKFVSAISKNGLDAFTERPGDLIDLIDYWNSFGQFAPLEKMVEHSIHRKLSEPDAYRADNEILSLKKAHSGAERLAAALTLCKSFTLKAPGQATDLDLSSGAVDPNLVFDGWTNAEQNALLRRGIFAPATYGRIRFHHRSTQEYLTAQWFIQILNSNCPKTEVWDLIFSNRYGVDTVVPSLRPSAAWLALQYPDFLEEIVRREPLILLRHGDPGSLPIETRKRLLSTFAEKSATGEIAEDSIDHRFLWMFADKRLSDTIRCTWDMNSKPRFRLTLLRLIREGAIKDCVVFAREIALDDNAADYHRVVAVEALDVCQDHTGLSMVARQISEAPSIFNARVASSFAKILYPGHLTTKQILQIIEKSRPPRESTYEGFQYNISDLYAGIPTSQDRREFVKQIADLCLSKPYIDEYRRISKRYAEIAKHLEPIAISEIRLVSNDQVPAHLIRLLMAIERVDRRSYADDEDPQQLNELLHNNIMIKRALFWADIRDQRTSSKNGRQAIHPWQISIGENPLWQLDETDLHWLHEDLLQSESEADQRMALNSILYIFQQIGNLEKEALLLRQKVKNNEILLADLEKYIAPPQESETALEYKREMEVFRRRRAEKEEKDKKAWQEFKQELCDKPEVLKNPQYLKSWQAGAFRLWTLTKWLMHRTEKPDRSVSLQWPLIEEGFGRQVAEAYRDGMKVLWRLTKPERPKHKPGGPSSIKYVTKLAFGAVGIEAAEESDWPVRLSEDEVKRATLHGCLSGQGYPDWIEKLHRAFPQTVNPILKRCLRNEWLSDFPGHSDFLHHYAYSKHPIDPAVQQFFCQMLTEKEPATLEKLKIANNIIKRCDIGIISVRKLTMVIKYRLLKYSNDEKIDFMMPYLSMLFELDPDCAAKNFKKWLEHDDESKQQEYFECTFAFLFGRSGATPSSLLNRISVAALKEMVLTAYIYIHPEHDLNHKGVYEPGVRDDAQRARDVLLGSLANRTGTTAYHAMKCILDDPECASHRDYFLELTHKMAERDAEVETWSPKEVVTFEQQHTAPAKTGADLLKVVLATLNDIQFQLNHKDASSRSLLNRANDEVDVQNWLAEQMELRSRGRYTVYREPIVARKNEPDLIISSTASKAEVAIEIKHGGKSWTVKQLEHALTVQLAEKYLKPLSRRHGVLVISHHGKRWREPETKKLITFESLICRLENKADKLIENSCGPIEVKCFGINADVVNKKS